MASDRLDPDLFDLPVERIRSGWYTDAYFNRSKELLDARGESPRVTMQVFQKHAAVLAGIDEAIAVLRTCSGKPAEGGGWEPGWEQLEVRALRDGDRIEPWESVMHVDGPYALFAHLETIYLGILARRTRLATNVAAVVEAAADKQVLFFPARHDHFLNQPGDGWAAKLAGASAMSTDAQASWIGEKGMGTVPHALIAAFGGDTVAAARAFADRFAADSNVTVLVDFENDSVRTSLEVAEALGAELWGVRLDTSGQLVDRALWEQMGDYDPTGVNVELARRVRRALDEAGHERVRIVVSGGFDTERIERFEAAGAPVDAYGVGSSLLRGAFDFTADVVCREGDPAAKVGRELKPNDRLEKVG
jgi:nicotinate phosphoribosyltransferase